MDPLVPCSATFVQVAGMSVAVTVEIRSSECLACEA